MSDYLKIQTNNKHFCYLKKDSITSIEEEVL